MHIVVFHNGDTKLLSEGLTELFFASCPFCFYFGLDDLCATFISNLMYYYKSISIKELEGIV